MKTIALPSVTHCGSSPMQRTWGRVKCLIQTAACLTAWMMQVQTALALPGAIWTTDINGVVNQNH